MIQIVFTLDNICHCVKQNYCLIDVKRKRSETVRYWADYMTLPFEHTHDLDLEVSRSKFEIALSHELEGRLIWKQRDVSHPFMSVTLTCV